MLEDLIARYPTIFHMAAGGSWPNIRRHGLLSTQRLLDLFEIQGERRERIVAKKREECEFLEHCVHGRAVIRDQKPIIESKLRDSLQDGLSLYDWYRVLNERVFFWVRREQLDVLLGAQAYRDGRHEVLIVDTARLIRDYIANIELSPMNTGTTKPMAHPRGRATFLPPYQFPYKERLQRRLEPVKELTVIGGVPNVRDYVLGVEVWDKGVLVEALGP